MTDDALRIIDAELHFGGHAVLSRFSLTVRSGETHGLVGPNGAGKTSALNCVSGLYRPQSGRIEMFGEDLLTTPLRRRLGRGLARSFQHPKFVDELDVEANILITAERRHAETRRQRGRAVETARQAMADAGVESLASQPTSGLTYGQRKRVDLARALAAEPRLLLLDEPLAGTHGDERAQMVTSIVGVRERGISTVLIEHDIGAVAEVSQSLTVMNFGAVLRTGDPANVLADPVVREAYLGTP